MDQMNHETPVVFRFDIFKGERDVHGKVKRIKSVGTALFNNGSDFATMKLKTFPHIKFYLLHESIECEKDFMIAIRRFDKKQNQVNWNAVGNGQIMSGENEGLIELTWDLFSCCGIYLSLPTNEIQSPIKEVA